MKERPHTNLRFTKVDLEAKVGIDNKIINPVIGHSVGIGIEREGITTTEIIIGPIIGIKLGTTTGVTIGEITISLMIDRSITDKTIGETIINKTIEGTTEIDKIIEEMTPNRGIGIEVRVERDQEITIVTILEMDICNKEPEHYQMTETGQSLGLGPTLRVSTNRDQLRCYRCGEYDHFMEECPNTSTDDEMGHSDMEQTSLQMLTHDNLPINSNGEVECLNL